MTTKYAPFTDGITRIFYTIFTKIFYELSVKVLLLIARIMADTYFLISDTFMDSLFFSLDKPRFVNKIVQPVREFMLT